MSILSDFEDRLSRGVEGLFAGAFRSPVQPAELAKALARAMDDGRRVGAGKVYVPTSYAIELSPEDHEQLGDFASTLAGELSTFLIGHAGEQGYDLVARPSVSFALGDGLKLGRFRVAAHMPGTPVSRAASSSATPTPGPKPAAAPRPSSAQAPLSERVPPVPVPPAHALATVTVSDLHHDIALKGERVEVGRLGECDLCLADANVSRVHAAFIRDDGGWEIRDLDSTNGTLVNGVPATRARLRDGDTIQIGATQLVYHEPRG